MITAELLSEIEVVKTELELQIEKMAKLTAADWTAKAGEIVEDLKLLRDRLGKVVDSVLDNRDEILQRG